MRHGTGRAKFHFSMRGLLGLAGIALLCAGCTASSGFLASDGPGRNTVLTERSDAQPRITVIDTTDAVVARLAAAHVDLSFAAAYPAQDSGASRIGLGDALQITVWRRRLPSCLASRPPGVHRVPRCRTRRTP